MDKESNKIMARKKRILTVDELSKAQHLDKLRTIDAYDHPDKKRTNNPPIGIAKFDRVAEDITTYQFDPNLDPTLEWAGKAEGVSFDVPDTSIHIQESIKPSKILRPVQVIGDDFENPQMSLFGEDPLEKQRRRRDALEFYKHGVDWTNRLIAGDSLVVMNSLLEKEGMAGQVQMCYIDPPYGIKYGSNFQPFINKRDVQDKKDADLSQEPEMITAFRDTWELGIHSYLTYLRNRLLIVRELLSDKGSVFIQISDENIHYVRNLCDEIFGKENFVSQIAFKKTTGQASKIIAGICDYLIWYAKDKKNIKTRHIYINSKESISNSSYNCIEFADGTWRRLTKDELLGKKMIPEGRRFMTATIMSQGTSEENSKPYEFNKQIYYPSPGNHWKPGLKGLPNLENAGRLIGIGRTLSYKRYADDFPVVALNNIWNDTVQSTFSTENIYVVQTYTKVIARCLLMTTDPDDLVLDITCGSGTTAYVAEQWGRRWITCDTSRVAIELAKERLMTASFDYYKLAHPEQGISSGFIYKTVPHITLKSIANNEPPAEETLYDQPEIDKSKVRVSGPFTVESLPAPIVKPLEEKLSTAEAENMTSKQSQWRSEMLATGILGKNGNKLDFSRIEPLEGSVYFQAEGETKENSPKRAIICFGSETKVMDARFIDMALNEAQNMRPTPGYIIFAAFQFGPEASQMLDETFWPGVTVLKVQMNTDLMTEDLKKKRSSNQSFWLVGQPDVELIKDGRAKNRYKVIVNGFDYYDVKKGTVISGTDSNIAMWMLDTNYDPMNCIEPNQVFFPMGGKKDGWNKLAKTLKAEINQELIDKYAGNESLWFTAEPNTMIAVKIIDDRGIESLRVLKVGEE